MNSDTFFLKLKYIVTANQFWLYPIFALVIMLLLNNSIFSDYIFLDATEYIWTANKISNFKDEFIQGGRPLLGIYCEFIYGTLCNTISDLKWARLFSLLWSIIFSTQVFYFLRKHKLYIYESAIFALLILTLPSFSVYFSWSATSEIPFLLSINFFAGVILLKNLKTEQHKLQNYIFPLIITVFSLCIYQSAITAFLIPIVFYFIITNRFTHKNIVIILLFMLIAMVLYFIIFKYLLYVNEIKPSTRTELDLLELPKKLIIFYLREIRVLIQGSGLLVASTLFFIVGAIGFFGFIYNLYIRNGKNKNTYIFICYIILVLPLSYLPNLLSGQNYFCSRAIAPTAILVLFYQFLFFRDSSITYKKFKKLSLILALSVLILSVVNLNYYITGIQVKEYTALKRVFLKTPVKRNSIVIIQPNNNFLQNNNFYSNKFADEFGSITSPRSWGPANLFKQVWDEHIVKLKQTYNHQLKISVVKQNEEIEDNNAIVVNIIDILKEEFSKD
ncbi:hypothetical protein ACKGJY_04330 [Hyunsoonleella sp. 2307UL5-6]|uniref:hypothetical protein n=1 Tax=Hyunsoonleella sp. 2307UL5-6 TaxID=3384768 RepID=UPI0039BCE3F5